MSGITEGQWTLHLYLFRHAESQANTYQHLRVVGRSVDSQLTGTGVEQAGLLGKFIGIDNRFDAIFCSPSVRTRQTLQAAFGTFPARVEISENLHEMSQGEWEGRLRSEVHTEQVLKAMNADNLNFSAPGGESQLQVRQRMLLFLDQKVYPLCESLGKSQQTIRVAAFTHGFAIKSLVASILEASPAMTHKIMLDYTSVTHLSYSPIKGWTLVTLGALPHLPERIKIH